MADADIAGESPRATGALSVSTRETMRICRERARLLELTHDAILVRDLGTDTIRYWNHGAEEMYGWTRDEAPGKVFRELVPTQLPEPVEQIHATLRRTGYWEGELVQTTRAGAQITVSSRWTLQTEQGELDTVLEANTDITQRKAYEGQMAEDRFRSLVRNLPDVITVVGVDGTVRYVSASVKRVLGHRPEDLLGASGLGFVHPEDDDRVQGLFRELLSNPRAETQVELRLRHADGSWRDIEAIGTNLLHEPGAGGIVVIYRDITERKALEARLQYRAFHDPLTGLANRPLFMDRLGHALARAARHKQPVGVLFLDLDRFKFVNDAFGHEAGDGLLISVARRLETCLRGQDTAARLGGDEFTALVEEIGGIEDATRVAERILHSFDEPFNVEERELFVTASIGVSVSTDGHEQPADLLRAADVAMYSAKNSGKAHYEVFDPTMGARALHRLELEAALRRALKHGEFRLYYQPKVRLSTGTVVGLEALVRWEHPERGLLEPREFIPLAEGSGLILAIGRWVLREACRQARAWQQQFPAQPPLEMCVNLSERQFRHPRLPDEITAALAEHRLEAHNLMLEVNENVVMQDALGSMLALEKLKALGVRIAIDDFGTGYSSLTYLHQLPVDTVKIDRSFVSGQEGDIEDAVVVQAAYNLGQALRLGVTAAGVETEEQLVGLQALGYELGQGYLFARPLPPEEILPLLERLAGGSDSRPSRRRPTER